jgi:transposase-like protein
LDYQSRKVLRKRVSEARKLSIRSDATVAELELREMLDDALSPEERAVLMIAHGTGIHKVAAATGIGRDRVHRLAHSFGVARAPKVFDLELRRKVIEDFDNRVHMSVIMERYGVSHYTVYRWNQDREKYLSEA